MQVFFVFCEASKRQFSTHIDRHAAFAWLSVAPSAHLIFFDVFSVGAQGAIDGLIFYVGIMLSKQCHVRKASLDLGSPQTAPGEVF